MREKTGNLTNFKNLGKFLPLSLSTSCARGWEKEMESQKGSVFIQGRNVKLVSRRTRSKTILCLVDFSQMC